MQTECRIVPDAVSGKPNGKDQGYLTNALFRRRRSDRTVARGVRN